MPFISREELDELRRSAEILPDVNQRANQLEADKSELSTALEGLRRSVRVNDAVEEALSQYDDQVILGDIEPAVIQQLVDEGLSTMRANLADGLKQQKRDEIFTELQITKGPAVRAELDELFEIDGTYKRIETETEEELLRTVAGDLVAEKKKEIEDSINDPATKEAFLQEHADEILAEAKVQEHGEAYLAEREYEWRIEAIEELHAKAEHDVLAQKAEIIARIQAQYVETRDGKQKLERIRNQAETEISKIAIDELLTRSNDAEHQRILAESAKLEAEKLDKKNKAEKLALDFTNGGVDTESMSESTVVKLRLGTIKVDEERDYYGKTTRTSRLLLNRMISVTAMGDGFFRVDNDTLYSSSNVYAARQGLEEGSMIKLGMLVRHTKGESATDELIPTLKAGAKLQYDTDTSTPDFTDTGLPLVDLEINGVSARKYDEVVEKLL